MFKCAITNILVTNNNVIGNIEYGIELLTWRSNPVKTTAKNNTTQPIEIYRGDKMNNPRVS